MTGAEAALLCGAAFALAHWPFEREQAKEIASTVTSQEASDYSKLVSTRWRLLLQSRGLWRPSGLPWSHELIQKRAGLSLDFALTPECAKVLVVAVRATLEEFKGNWEEFCVAIPGALHWYDVDVDVLLGGLVARMSMAPFSDSQKE